MIHLLLTLGTCGAVDAVVNPSGDCVGDDAALAALFEANGLYYGGGSWDVRPFAPPEDQVDACAGAADSSGICALLNELYRIG